jgi:dTDP-4-amino-4,6-dideoxygalactose transaminase
MLRRRNASILARLWGGLEALRIPSPAADIHHAYYKFYVYVVPERLKAGWSRDRLLAEVTKRGVPCFQGSCSEIYRERAFLGASWAPGEFLEKARQLGETSLMFLVHPTLSESYIRQAGEIVATVVTEATD